MDQIITVIKFITIQFEIKMRIISRKKKTHRFQIKILNQIL